MPRNTTPSAATAGTVAANGRFVVHSVIESPLHHARWSHPFMSVELDFQLYAVWCDKSENRVASCIEACCRVCAKADFISAHFWGEGLAAPSLAHPPSGEEPLEDLSSSPPLKKLNQRSPKSPLKIPWRSRTRALNELNRLYSLIDNRTENR